MEKLKLKESEREDFLDEIRKANYKTSLISGIVERYSKITYKDIKKPTIRISANVLEQMYALVAECDTECQWHGLVDRDLETNTYRIHEVLMFDQKNSGVSTDTDEDTYNEWLVEIMKTPDRFKQLRLHGHSHVNMAVYSSGVDDQFQKDILKTLQDGDFYIYFIMNKKRELCIFIYDYEQGILFSNNDKLSEIEIVLTNDEDKAFAEEAKELLKKHSKPSITTYKTYGRGYDYSYKPKSTGIAGYPYDRHVRRT